MGGNIVVVFFLMHRIGFPDIEKKSTGQLYWNVI